MRAIAIALIAACGSHGHATEPRANPADGGTPAPVELDGAVAEASPPDAEPPAPPDAAPEPPMAPGRLAYTRPKVTGDVPADTVQHRIKEHGDELLGCYERERALHHDLEGKVTVEITIGDDGAVTNTETHGLDSAVDSCLTSLIDTIEFPAPKKTSRAIVDFTLIFSAIDTGG